MVTVVITIHVIVCFALCITILLQHGKGADIGAVFGGSSQTVFGAGGAGNALTKATWSLAAIFFATSIFLALSSARRVTGSIFDRPFSSAPSSSVMPPAKAPSKAAPLSAAPANQAAPAQNPASGNTPATRK
ncbi:MAG: preprotein translocase subunit SecG [Candidatus Binatus sp.]|uniref:preprotein translocase subunit SecG n=1 Tax=Candidatus Binatus sp. TaxID=2811406 RepID=UPI0027240C2F|nr:preprotein translocase subunit SecG [Candidatus Binatus sp.]MDO8431873.1 preprotein translocase subunit SecG [Candidatus Binatus sp.]